MLEQPFPKDMRLNRATEELFVANDDSPFGAPEEKRPHRPAVVWINEYDDGEIVQKHHHVRGQLVYAVSGVMELTTSGGFFLVPPQRAVWIPPQIKHKMRARGKVSLRTVYISPEDCAAGLSHDLRTIEVSNLLRELIIRGAEIDRNAQLSSRDEKLFSLILDEIKWAPDGLIHLPMARDARLIRICQSLIADPGDDRTLADWASQVGASTRTLSRLFQGELGTSFVVWRQHLRVLSAIPRLAAGEPVTVIALELGYETHSAFAAMFRRLTGSIPSHYFRA